MSWDFETSPYDVPPNIVSAAVTAPEPTVLRNTRKVVATPAVAAAEATDRNCPGIDLAKGSVRSSIFHGQDAAIGPRRQPESL
jgi:hypothetical protein